MNVLSTSPAGRPGTSKLFNVEAPSNERFDRLLLNAYTPTHNVSQLWKVASMDKTTGKDLVDFLDYAAEKALMEPNSAAAQKTAVQKVLGMDGDLSQIDVATLDVDEQLRRFEIKFKSKFTPGSLNTYGSRIRSAVSNFLAWSEDPASWKPSRRAPRASADGKKVRQVTKQTIEDDESPSPSSPPTFESRTRLVDYPFPLREGLRIRLALPEDIKRAEVRRICGFMNSLAVDADEQGGV